MPAFHRDMSEAAGADRTRPGVVLAVILGGLALDQAVEFWGQVLTNAAV